MRDLAELELYQDRPIPPPSDTLIKEFEQTYQVKLPDEYIQLLKYCNGGYSEHNCFCYDMGDGIIGQSSMGAGFFALSEDKSDNYGAWGNTDFLREILNAPVVAFAENEGGDKLYFLFEGEEYTIHIFFHDSRGSQPKIASSFAEFIDKLFIEDDLI